jgi:hypothetical protein
VTFAKGLGIVLSLLSFLVLAALPTQAAGASVGVLVAPARLDLAIKPDDTTLERDLTVLNRGSAPNTFTVSAVDVVIAQGVPEVLPPGSTPYSSATITTLSTSTLTLNPGKSGIVRVNFDVSGHKPLLGGLLVVPGQQASGGTAGAGSGVGISTTPEALVTVSAGPVDSTGELLPSVLLGLAPVSLPLPMFAESGPLAATATLRNSGNSYERVLSTYQFSNLGRAFLTIQAPPTSAMPDATASTRATTVQRLEVGGSTVDTAPWLCVCQVRVSTVAWLAGRQTDPLVQSQTVLIFPWRLAGVVLGLLALSIAARLVWRRRSP